MKLYHGSPIKNLTKLVSCYGNCDTNLEKYGIYLTSDYELAKSYATTLTGTGSVYTVIVADAVILDLTTEGNQNKFFQIISEEINYDLTKHDNYSLFSHFLINKKSQNGIWTLVEDVISVLEKTSSVNSYELRVGKKDIRQRDDFHEFCQNIRKVMMNELHKYDLHFFRNDKELIYVLKRPEIEIIQEDEVNNF